MDVLVDDTSRRLALRLRLERETRGWSLGELAERSGVSKAMISKVERGEASPTASLLVRLAGAFEMTLAALLTRAEGAGGNVSRAEDQPRWTDPASGYTRRQVFARSDHPMELVEIELPPGAKVDFPAASYAFIRQLVWVLAGELTILEGERRTALAAGDAYAYGEPADSCFLNMSALPCRYLVSLSRR